MGWPAAPGHVGTQPARKVSNPPCKEPGEAPWPADLGNGMVGTRVPTKG